MSAYDEQLCRQFRCCAQDHRHRRSIAKHATAYGVELMHALVKPLLPDLSHLIAEIHRRYAIEISIKGTHRRDQIKGIKRQIRVWLAAVTPRERWVHWHDNFQRQFRLSLLTAALLGICLVLVLTPQGARIEGQLPVRLDVGTALAVGSV
jgi:hypothetical protein